MVLKILSSELHCFRLHTVTHRVMEAQFKVVALLFFLYIKWVLTQQPPLSSESERRALLDLRSSLGIRAREWPRRADPCFNWTGVECGNRRVIGIALSGLRRTRVGRLNPGFSVDSLANLTLLASFNASGFSLPGSIPDWFGDSLGELQVLDLRSCSINGPIPPSLGRMSRLNLLYLADNSLTGFIPPTLGQLLSLSVLQLSRNLLTGSIPSEFSALRNLTRLELPSNFLSGPIPPGFGSLSSLQLLNLSNNSLTASFPAQLGNLSQLIELDLGFNSLSGSLPDQLGRLRSLQRMLIGNNYLEGPLPDSLLSIHQLRFLDASGNNFTRVFPNLTSFNATVATFNFSNNLFYGNLYSPVGRFYLIDVSGNYLQSLAPNNTGNHIIINRNCVMRLPDQRRYEDCRMFYDDRGQTFGNNDTTPDSMQPSLPEPSRSRRRLIYILVGVFGGLGFIVISALVLLLLLKKYGKRSLDEGNANVGSVSQVGNTPPSMVSFSLTGLGESFTYEQLLQASSDFSDTNLIKHGHSGDIFRGTLGGEFPVIIKRVDLRFFQKESYMSELDFFSKATHPRLVPLLGHCLEHENEKLLVYKYMPNGDLCNSFYRATNLENDNLQSLDWITRLKIAIGAAEALTYLHHECNPPFVHRDIRASSILLDDSYEVRLGSLSEVHAQGGSNHQNIITKLLRMPQTSQQGTSGSSSITCAYDVYCFGKVLLELVTGKIGISEMDDASTKELLEQSLPFISIDDKELVLKIVDQSLIVYEDLLEEVWAVAIVAKSCLNPKPSRRPLMRHILRALENPFKVVRDENFNSARLRTTSSTRSWSAVFFGSWQHSSSESSNLPSQTNKEGISALKQSRRVGSHSSGANEHSSSNKRLSSEIFPEPADLQDLERQEEN